MESKLTSTQGGALQRIVLIDSDRELVQRIAEALKEQGYGVHSTSDYQEGLEQIARERPDVVVVDAHQAMSNGGRAWGRLRELTDVPVMMLTPAGRAEAIAGLLEQGVSDYLTKPFDMEQLITRLRVLLRRLHRAEPEAVVGTYADHYLAVNLADRRVMVEGKLVQLTPTEYRLLGSLLRQAGRVLTYAELLEEVWGPEYVDYVDYVRIYVWRLRKKMERDPQQPDYILTEHGIGYRFEGANSAAQSGAVRPAAG